MKKGLFVICIVMALSLFACDNGSGTNSSPDLGSQGGFVVDQGSQGTGGGFVGPKENNPGGFGSPSGNVTTVAQAMNLRDDTLVTMQGRITRFLGDDKYSFQDNTGTITLEIERRAWGTVSVNENTLIEIFGEIDRDRNSIEVDVRSIRVIGGTTGDGQGGFGGPSASITTVAQALNLHDDAPVIMRGRIVSFLGNEKYTFTDNTGSMTVEIERRAWGTLTVGPNDTVEISGEIDREWDSVEVDVNRIGLTILPNYFLR